MPVYKTKNEKTKDNRIWYFKCNYRDVYGNTKSKKSKKFATKEEATKAEAKFLIMIGENKSKSLTFNDIYNEYIEKKKKRVRPQTIIKNENLYKYIKDTLGNIKIEKLTLDKYEKFKYDLNNKPVSTDYKNRIHKFVISLINYSDTYYNVNNKAPIIAGGFVNPFETKKEMEFFTLSEFEQFSSAINDIFWITLFDMLFYCGLRQGELQALNWNDIDFDKGTVTISKTLTTKLKGQKWSIFPPKTKSSYRTLPLTKQVKDNLKSIYEMQLKLDGFRNNWFVFGGIKPTPETTIQNHKNNYCEKANVKQIRIHDFRHSCASLLISKNADPVLVAKYLGHADVSMTLNRYSHMYKSKLDEMVNLIEN